MPRLWVWDVVARSDRGGGETDDLAVAADGGAGRDRLSRDLVAGGNAGAVDDAGGDLGALQEGRAGDDEGGRWGGGGWWGS